MPDLAIVRYEYANSLLYTFRDEPSGRCPLMRPPLPRYSMEWLDRAYARKRLKEVQAW